MIGRYLKKILQTLFFLVFHISATDKQEWRIRVVVGGWEGGCPVWRL